MSKPYPAKKSRFAVTLVSIFSFIYTVSAMHANGIMSQSPEVSPSPSESPTITPTVVTSATPSTVKTTKLKKKKAKTHTTTGASKKK